ncbi:MAG: phosphomannose isomerase type II C-terminal cupin domain [Alphaproteobacteria bacterium]|nr:phosphomannose isomerase type II C-terminal cupin domain [Alphaproteobacteria bacterium]
MDQTAHMAAYKVGDSDTRPWGSYVVTRVGANDAGEDVCEKDITVNSGQVLSLQSHDHRRELWRVEKGELTVLLDGVVSTLKEGQSIVVPVGSIHCMANKTSSPVVVCEVQEGLCREEDIVRYMDAYGRSTVESDDPRVQKSLAAYKNLLEDVQG